MPVVGYVRVKCIMILSSDRIQNNISARSCLRENKIWGDYVIFPQNYSGKMMRSMTWIDRASCRASGNSMAAPTDKWQISRIEANVFMFHLDVLLRRILRWKGSSFPVAILVAHGRWRTRSYGVKSQAFYWYFRVSSAPVSHNAKPQRTVEKRLPARLHLLYITSERVTWPRRCYGRRWSALDLTTAFLRTFLGCPSIALIILKKYNILCHNQPTIT